MKRLTSVMYNTQSSSSNSSRSLNDQHDAVKKRLKYFLYIAKLHMSSNNSDNSNNNPIKSKNNINVPQSQNNEAEKIEEKDIPKIDVEMNTSDSENVEPIITEIVSKAIIDALNILSDMGFNNRMLNQALLYKNGNDIVKTIADLMEEH